MTIIDAPARGRIRSPACTKSFGGVHAVRDVELDLAGGVVGLLGPERRRQVHPAADAGHRARPRRGPDLGCSVTTRRCRQSGWRSVAGWASCRSRPALYGGFTALEMVDYVAILKEHTDSAARRRDVVRACWRPSVSPT